MERRRSQSLAEADHVFRFPFVAVAAAFTLSGCVVVWGGAYKVEAQNPVGVTIRYDGHFTSLKKIETVAQATCGQFAKVASLQKSDTSVWGLTTVTFACDKERG